MPVSLHHPGECCICYATSPALAVRELHKAALWGFVQQALATFSEHPDTLHQPVVRKVLRDNLLLAMGTMLEEAQPMVSAESISHQSYRRPCWRRPANMCWKTGAEPLTVRRPVPAAVRQPNRTLQNAFHAILGIGPNAWLKRIRLNAVRRELMKSQVRAGRRSRRRPCSGDSGHLGQFATDYQQLFAEKPSMTLPTIACASGCERSDAAAGWPAAIRPLQPVAHLNKLAQRRLGTAGLGLIIIFPAHQRRHRHQNRLRTAPPVWQAEQGAAVPDQIELDVAAAAIELKVALALVATAWPFGVRRWVNRRQHSRSPTACA